MQYQSIQINTNQYQSINTDQSIQRVQSAWQERREKRDLNISRISWDETRIDIFPNTGTDTETSYLLILIYASAPKAIVVELLPL